MNTLNDKILNASGNKMVAAQTVMDRTGSSNRESDKGKVKIMKPFSVAISKRQEREKGKKAMSGEQMNDMISYGGDGSVSANVSLPTVETSDKNEVGVSVGMPKIVIPKWAKATGIIALIAIAGIIIYKKFKK